MASAAVVKCADPPASETGTPVAPSTIKRTVPVGVGPLPVTAAVKATASPNSEGLSEDVSATLLAAVPKVKKQIELGPPLVATGTWTAPVAGPRGDGPPPPPPPPP